MKKFKKALVLMMGATLSIGTLVGCSSGTAETPATGQTVQVDEDTTVVATIDGVEIGTSLYNTYLWSAQQVLEQISGPAIWEMELEGRSTEDWAKENALESVTLAVVTEKAAAEMGIELSAEQKELAAENARAFAEANGEELVEHQFTQANVEEVLLAAELSTMIQEEYMANYEPSEEDIQSFIAEYSEMYEQVTAKHVLIQTVDEMGQTLPEETIVERRELAESILEKALAGEDMAALALEFSEDPGSKDADGEYTFYRGEMVPEFEAAAFDGTAGEVWPELVETTYGYHIIKTEEHIPADENLMREEFTQNESINFVNMQLQEMIDNADVQTTEVYETVRVKYEGSEATTEESTDETVEEATEETTDETVEESTEENN